MGVVSMKALLEAGVHFGHQVKRWNPKMKKYIFGARNDIYIIDLQKTMKGLEEAYSFVKESAFNGATFLFVGTKKQAQESLVANAQRCGSFWVNQRWLGGMLTNFETIKKSINRLKKIETMKEDGTFEVLTKKERARLDKEMGKLDRNLSGIKDMKSQPDVIIVIDPKKETLAVAEGRKLKIPIVGLVDSNCDPDLIDYVIPGNDDAIRAISLITLKMAEAVNEGKEAKLKITGEEEAAAAEGETPAEETGAPVEKAVEEAPDAQEEATAEKTETPAEKAEAPVEEIEAPKEDAPAAEAEASAEKIEAPAAVATDSENSEKESI